MAFHYIVLDIAAAPLANAADFLDLDDIAAPSNWKDEAKIAAYVADKKAEALASCALDPDLCRISGVGELGATGDPIIAAYGSQSVYQCDEWEAWRLTLLAQQVDEGARLISYNGLRYDWPVLNARARHLGVKLHVSLDRYKTPHLDLYAKLTNYGQLKGHSLQWWVKRLGWTDLQKPLDGKDEARVFETGQWDALADSLRHDVTATRRLAAWCGVL